MASIRNIKAEKAKLPELFLKRKQAEKILKPPPKKLNSTIKRITQEMGSMLLQVLAIRKQKGL